MHGGTSRVGGSMMPGRMEQVWCSPHMWQPRLLECMRKLPELLHLRCRFTRQSHPCIARLLDRRCPVATSSNGGSERDTDCDSNRKIAQGQADSTAEGQAGSNPFRQSAVGIAGTLPERFHPISRRLALELIRAAERLRLERTGRHACYLSHSPASYISRIV